MGRYSKADSSDIFAFLIGISIPKLHSYINIQSLYHVLWIRFRVTLWQEVDLTEAEKTLEDLWMATSLLPPAQQEWTATRQLRISICYYRDILPLLARLHSKVKEPITNCIHPILIVFYV